MLHLSKLISQEKFWILSILIIFSLLYFLTLPRVNVGYSDSDELITVGYHLGVAHPPGYPIYSGLVYLFTHLPISGTIAYKAHLLSSLFSLLTLITLFKSAKLIFSKLHSEILSKVNPNLIAFLTVGVFASSFLFWLYSIIAEVFAMHIFISSLLIYQTIFLVTTLQPISKARWYLLATTLGLGISHHQIFILFLPMAFWTLVTCRNSINLHVLIRFIFICLVTFI